jgi:mRNA-degrading endonuclease RelE of RelBE toxin-antitoxin system
MSAEVVYTALFEKEAKRLAKKYPSLIDDVLKLVELLEKDPEQGVALGKGFYKIRIAIGSKRKGKSGGARVITYVLFSNNTVFLTSIYDKSEHDNVNTSVLLKLMKEEGLIAKH